MRALRFIFGSGIGMCILAIMLCCVCFLAGCKDNEPDTTEIFAENEPNDSLAQATSIPLGVTVIGTVSQNDDPQDFYLISVLISGTYVITLGGFGPNDLDLVLYDQNGLLLAVSNVEGTTREISRFLNSNTQYVIEVKTVDAPSTTSYTLRIDRS